jgi:FixJ family two-component response regulator
MSMVSNGASHKVGATLAHPTVSPKKSVTIDAAFARRPEEPVVFIIDDDVSVRESLESLFKDVCLQAELFGSVSEFLASRLPDAASCLVLDVRLRGMSGLDFQAQLARANIDIPIVFISGYADIPLVVRTMKAGAVDFLTKPFREQDMLDAVETAIARDRMRREDEKRASKMRALFETLSPRERQVMDLVTSGLMNKQVAAKTGLAEATVKVHRGQVMQKMGAKSIADLVKMAETLATHRNNSQRCPWIEHEGGHEQGVNWDFSCSPNIQSQAFARPRHANTASPISSGVLPQTRPSRVTEVSTEIRRNLRAVSSARCS